MLLQPRHVAAIAAKPEKWNSSIRSNSITCWELMCRVLEQELVFHPLHVSYIQAVMQYRHSVTASHSKENWLNNTMPVQLWSIHKLPQRVTRDRRNLINGMGYRFRLRRDQ